MSRVTEKNYQFEEGKRYQGKIISAKYLGENIGLIQIEVLLKNSSTTKTRTYAEDEKVNQWWIFELDMDRLGFNIYDYDSPYDAIEALDKAKPDVEFTIKILNNGSKQIKEFFLATVPKEEKVEEEREEMIQEELSEEDEIPSDLVYKTRTPKVVDGYPYIPVANTKILYRRVDDMGIIMDLFGASLSHGVGSWDHNKTWKQIHEILRERKRNKKNRENN